MKETAKQTARVLATILAIPWLISYWVRARIVGKDLALEASSQSLSLLPGAVGQYIRNAFLRRVLDDCAPTAVIEFGTLFSKAGARIGAHAYIGPRCQIGLAQIGPDVLIAAGVHIPSGPRTHGIADPSMPIREQPGERQVVTIGAGTWIGSAAIVLADVGANCVVGAGTVVTRPLPDSVIAVGNPARVSRSRDGAESQGLVQVQEIASIPVPTTSTEAVV